MMRGMESGGGSQYLSKGIIVAMVLALSTVGCGQDTQSPSTDVDASAEVGAQKPDKSKTAGSVIPRAFGTGTLASEAIKQAGVTGPSEPVPPLAAADAVIWPESDPVAASSDGEEGSSASDEDASSDFDSELADSSAAEELALSAQAEPEPEPEPAMADDVDDRAATVKPAESQASAISSSASRSTAPAPRRVVKEDLSTTPVRPPPPPASDMFNSWWNDGEQGDFRIEFVGAASGQPGIVIRFSDSLGETDKVEPHVSLTGPDGNAVDSRWTRSKARNVIYQTGLKPGRYEVNIDKDVTSSSGKTLASGAKGAIYVLN